ncbi:efflux transporter outer membrane subunit [Mycetohabitans endofungorum]|uniref:efflux transporter outer membrane subunit n=1 Tax=Mycetohabitans endofungorum TaxID=417203 RepID=UPI002B057935|nr:efflux transporter outer membrane subunit [Mycetohabitans endofungorum]
MNKSLNPRVPPLAPLLGALLVLAGCSLAPTYERPLVAMPHAFKEAPANATDAVAHAGSWKPAQPSEDVARGPWWKVFGDATLDGLEAQALDANQNLKAALARVKQARALNQSARSELFPQLNAGLGPTRQKSSPASQFLPPNADGPSQTFWRAQGTISYEADLFGRVASSIDASRADLQQNEALLRSVQLALQADVAQNYFSLRELDAEQDLYTRTVALREQALQLVQHRFDEGDISELDVARATSELATARSDAMTLARLRAVSEHSLAILLGKPPAQFSLAPRPLEPVTVQIPAGLPSALLERRPDIAAAERAMAAANARVGIAKAAFFPSLTLTGAGGFESASLGDLFRWTSRTFLLGPMVGTALTMPLFDGGARSANLANARAKYEEDVANYRQQVLVAFQEVEDNLANLRILTDQIQAQNDAVQASGRAAQLSRAQYREGSVSYLDVIDSERTVLQNQRAAVQLTGAQAVYTVNLIRALGGGWNAPTSPTQPASPLAACDFMCRIDAPNATR